MLNSLAEVTIVSPAMLADFARKLESKRFFGKVTLSVEAGKITNVRPEQSLKPQDVAEW